MIHIIDFEVLKHDWMCVIASLLTQDARAFNNAPNKLREFYQGHKNDIFIGYNIREYDQWIFRWVI